MIYVTQEKLAAIAPSKPIVSFSNSALEIFKLLLNKTKFEL